MITWIDRGDGVWFGVAIPVVCLCLGNSNCSRVLLVEGNQVQRVVGCGFGEFSYIGICLRYNDNRGYGVSGCEVIGNGVIEIYGVFPLEFYIVFGNGNSTAQSVGIV